MQETLKWGKALTYASSGLIDAKVNVAINLAMNTMHYKKKYSEIKCMYLSTAIEDLTN